MKSYSEFIVSWQENVELWSMFFLVLAFLVFVFYSTGFIVSKDRSKLYDYVSTHEIPAFMNLIVMVSLSITFFANSLLIGEFKTANNFELVIQSIGSLVIGGMFYSVMRVLLKIYYPFYLAKHLKRIRFKPMKSSSGNQMKLLNEDEEDLHLTQEQIEHEEIFAFDYDVWVDEETGEKVVEKYDIHHTNQVCDKCRFRTLRELKEEVEKMPTQTEGGELTKYYKCDYCGHQEEKKKHLSPLNES
ncbi:MAG: hypothetical protein RIC80_03240 [Cyclobacteriaceae bacterium]